MAPPTWATKEQRQFLLKEDPSWTLIKASGRTLKSFYTQTTRAFLEKWPRTPSVEILALAKGDEAAAKALVEQQAWDVSRCVSIYVSSTLSDRSYPSKSHRGMGISTVKRRRFQQLQNLFLTSPESTRVKNRHSRSGKLSQLCTIAQPTPHSALR